MPDFGNQNPLGDIADAAYCVDIALLIDVTGSMGSIISKTKADAMSFCEKFHESMEASGKNVDQLRIKVIPFRDYAYDGNEAMADSGFFMLPDQNTEFQAYVDGLNAAGGGDEPESALEAMALAMRSDWTKEGTKRRHVILVFSDASAVPLQDPNRTKNPAYPANMPKDLAELADMWSGVSQELSGMPDAKAARLVVFAPNSHPWTDLEVWNKTWISYSKAGQGLDEVSIQMAIDLLVASVA
jgi:hypothetical protein